ncbi:MAG: hypothetical protein FIB03_14490 [Anaerolineae bacterium]|nr:hypothetical protein [Anaerolineae bacterium]
MMILAAVFASLSGEIDLYLSFTLSITSRAGIVLTATMFFMAAPGWERIKDA